MKFRVNARSVHYRYNLLTKRMQANLKFEEKASGSDIKILELVVLLEKILEKEKVAKEKLDIGKENKRKMGENDKVAAKYMRYQALERSGQTAKKKKGDDSSETSKTKSRRSAADALEYPKQKPAKRARIS